MKKLMKSLVMLMIVFGLFGNSPPIYADDGLSYEYTESVIQFYGDDSYLPEPVTSSVYDVVYSTYDATKYLKTTKTGFTTLNLEWLQDDLVVKAYNDSYGRKPLLPVKDRKKWTYVGKIGAELIAYQKSFPNQKAVPNVKMKNYDILLLARAEVWKAWNPVDRVGLYKYFSKAQMTAEFKQVSTRELYNLWSVMDDDLKWVVYNEYFGNNQDIYSMMQLTGLAISQKANLMIDMYNIDPEHDFRYPLRKGINEPEVAALIVEYLRVHGYEEIINETVNLLGTDQFLEVNEFLLSEYGYYLESNYDDVSGIPSWMEIN